MVCISFILLSLAFCSPHTNNFFIQSGFYLILTWIVFIHRQFIDYNIPNHSYFQLDFIPKLFSMYFKIFIRKVIEIRIILSVSIFVIILHFCSWWNFIHLIFSLIYIVIWIHLLIFLFCWNIFEGYFFPIEKRIYSILVLQNWMCSISIMKVLSGLIPSFPMLTLESLWLLILMYQRILIDRF